MSQQLVKKGANGKHENVMPKSWIEAIKDKYTGQSLLEILQGFNMYFLSYNGDTSATRCLVPIMLRKKGLWITYVKYDGNVYTEWYASSKIDDKSWGDSSNWRIGNNTLVGDITISSNGNWVINGTETEFKAVGEKGNTPLIRVDNNRLQVSYDLGDTYTNVTENPVYTQFRNHNNKIQISTDLGATWTDASEEIAAYFRWQATSGDTQANNVGRVQISRDNITWVNLSNDIVNNLHISRYIGINELLPTSGIAEGTIYAKGPYYAEDDTLNDNPIYRLWVYAWKGNTLAWQDNGEFQSIAAGVVQETGDSETEVMSQKAVTEKLSELYSKTGSYECSTGGTIADKVVQVDNIDNLDNCNILVVFRNKNQVDDNVTLTVGNVTRQLRYNGEVVSSLNTWDSMEAVIIKAFPGSYYFDAYKIGRNSHDEDKYNKVTDITPLNTDEQYPSAAAAYKLVLDSEKRTEEKIEEKIAPLLGTEDKEINISDYSPRGEYLDGELIWNYGDGVSYASICIPIKGGRKVNVISSTNRNSFATFLKDNSVVVGQKANVCDSVTNRIVMEPNTNYIFDVPTDCNFIYFSYLNGSVETYPQNLVEIGYEGIFSYPYYIKDAIDRIESLNTSNFINIAFMTDSHGNGDLLEAGGDATKSIQTLRYLNQTKQLDLLVHGGDVILTTDNTTSTKSKLILDIQSHLKEYADIDNLVFIKGNHDAGHQNEEGTTENLDNFEYRALYQTGKSYFETVAPINNYFKETYFYKDVSGEKIRIIFLDAWHEYNTLGNSNKMSFGTAQENWLCETLSTVPDGWTVIVFTHYFGFNNNTIAAHPLSKNTSDIVKAFNEKSTYGNYTFSSTAKLAGVVMGHEHQDVYNNSLGFNTIRVDASYKKDGDAEGKDMCVSVFTIDTINNVLHETRIGRGDNHSYKFGDENKQLY